MPEQVCGAAAAAATGEGLSPPRYASRAAVASWIFFDWAAQPFFTLVTTFVYAPYFASHVAADAVRGQELWGYATAAAGLTIALLSPVLGAIADASGRRKPWIAAFGVLLVIGSTLLWFGRPGEPSATALVLVAFAIGTIGAEFATVFNNAMMPTLVPPERIGRLSGTGWATGYVGGMVSLVITLGLLAASPDTGLTLLGFKPLFGLDAASHAGDRLSGPLSALWFMVFVLPMFLITPDHAAKHPASAAIRHGLASLRATLGELPHNRRVALFLIANMIYADGLVALFAFGGIYAAGTFGWSTIEIGVFGILLTITGTLGAWLGGKLDDAFGPRAVIIASLIVLMGAAIAILSIGRDHIGFVFAVAPPNPGDGLYAAPAEKAYVALGLLIGLAAGPVQAASRSLLIRVAPPARITQYFGLFALSGKVTSFMGPLMVGLVTGITMSQKAGMAVLVAFFAVGLTLLVRSRAR
ncbi:MAG: MFS transporter [Xanthobacteraceae bacterium]|nr:MAG: MFS transporter [Xanthobacteraceae bacterium]